MYAVSVIDANGCKASASQYITVQGSPSPRLTNSAVCSGIPVFLDAGNSGSTYKWDSAGGSTQQAISVQLAGTYRVTVTNNGGCSIVDSAIVSVAGPPLVNLGNDTAICFRPTSVFECSEY